jgi:histidinol-phosphate/aromatic aminotransferase/cobyric acid decarboxylase-like protein
MISPQRPANAFELMNFRQFIAWSEEARQQAPHVERYCETRIARALSHLRVVPGASRQSNRIHRCDLVRLWCKAMGIPSLARMTLASEGVRHSLQVIFALLAKIGAAVAIPIDVYPVYWQLAAAAGLRVVGFETFPQFDLCKILDAAAEAGTHHVLLPQPLKLHGRSWTDREVAIAEDWLRTGIQRRIILDGVYRFGAPLDSVTKRLMETGQVVFLDSLSKGWLHEGIFGAAVIPERDASIYTATFRNLPTSLSKLSVACALIECFSDIPCQVSREIDAQRVKVLASVARVSSKTLPVERGYFLPIECSTERLLTEHSMVTIPASVFGSRLSHWSVASALRSADL